MPRFRNVHPATPPSASQGWLQILVELEEALCEVTGMAAATLQPAAGRGRRAHRAAPHARLPRPSQRRAQPGDHPRLRPRHEPGFGDARRLRGVDGRHRLPRPRRSREAPRPCSVPTWPGSCSRTRTRSGCSKKRSSRSPKMVHDAGGLLYYDGANLNPILGVVRPGRHGLRHRPPQLAQDLRHPPRRRRAGCGSGRRRRRTSSSCCPVLARCARARASATTTPAHSIGRIHSWHGQRARLAARLDLHQAERRRGIEARRARPRF